MIKKWSIRYPAVGGEEERRAYVYLPTMYEADPDRRYPVLYMFDGQNVFFFRFPPTAAGQNPPAWSRFRRIWTSTLPAMTCF